MVKTTFAALAFAALLAAAPSLAAGPAPKVPAAPAVSAPAAAAAMPMAEDAKKMKAKACIAEADKQGLHGKARKAFKRKCKMAA